jgi:hypothetical protein
MTKGDADTILHMFAAAPGTYMLCYGEDESGAFTARIPVIAWAYTAPMD